MKHLKLHQAHHHKKRIRGGYSLVEVVVSLGIMGVVMTMLFSVLILSLQITFKILARSVVREEISNISALVARDIRNADIITNCGAGVVCEVVLNGDKFQWTKCGDRICKNQITASGQNTVYRSTENIRFSLVNFDIGFADATNKARQNILITLVGSHTNASFNVNNVIKQLSVSTRNYEL